uniref:ABC-type xenobiotic transporter n=1 Tax=Cajanus cajan TaxID=3821 RepID=A0A151SMJ0_CAJCA|nr:ABC transporter C family member 5 [Cajanus cajan]
MGVSGFFHDILGLPVLELATICVNLTFVLLFLFVVSVRRVLVYEGGFGFDKDGNTGNAIASPICSVVSGEARGVRIGAVFKLSVLSCFYVLFVHVLALGFDGGGLILGADVDLSLLSVPAVLGLAWFVLSFSALNCKFKVSERFPFLLRVWWFLSFVICLCTLFVDGRGFWEDGSKHLSSRAVANVAVTPALALLCVVAIRGGTGIRVCGNSDLQEPLLVEEEPGCLKVTPYRDAGLFSLATLSWMNPLLSIGAKRPLELKDIPLVAPRDRAKSSYKVLNSNWERLKAEHDNPSKQPSLAWAILMSFWKEAALNAIFAGVNTLVSYVGPYMVSYFVDYLGGKETFPHEGYILAGIFFVAKLVETVTTRQWYLGVDILGMHVRSALTAMVYRKGLRLSSSAKQSHTSGEIVNYMAVDVQRVGDFSWYLHDMWMLPLQIALALLILYKNVGIASVATLIATIISIVVTVPVARIQEDYQDKLMAAKDERMRKTSESLRSMRILKLQAWEDRYRLKLEEMQIMDGVFCWDSASPRPTLSGIHMKVEKGMTVAVCGMVGSGKSSFLSCILGEIPKLSGEVRVCGSVAYVSQSAWIQSGNIEENILFGTPMDKAKYKNVLHACSLKKDLELLSHGDQTIIGDRGINLSGGQKQRIQLARALYQGTDIYLLDDPFSAVDAHTGSELFREYVLTALADKTVIFVTHQVEFLPAADMILVLKEGHIIQAGKYDDLLQAGTDFKTLKAIKEKKKAKRSRKKQLVQEEERVRGRVSMKVYLSYMAAAYKGLLIPLIILAQTLFQFLQIASNWWMAWANPQTEGDQPKVTPSVLLLVYMALAFGSSWFIFVRAVLVATFGLAAAQKLFFNMLRSIFRAPMSFFDTTPAGRILNRVSIDQSVVDLDIPFRLGGFASSTIQLIGIVAVMTDVTWQVLFLVVPMAIVCLWMQKYYMASSRELVRIVSIQKSPIIHLFGESIAGAATIRGFGQEKRFMKRNLYLLDCFARPFFYSLAAIEWLCLRMELLSTFVFAFCLVLLVSLPHGSIDPSMAGLAVTYGLNLNGRLSRWILSFCKLENKIISIERIYQYSQIPSEAPTIIEDSRPPSSWPENGTIQLIDLKVRYKENLPVVLHGISCTFPGGKKIGIVGRTGSGKSTLIQALFRLVEPEAGSILIDNINISAIGLHDLRSHLSIIPQDPTLFEGTIRSNLDPLEEHSDQEIWEALDKSQLGDIIRESERKLDMPVLENGDNWSVGQWQLVSLGRALLKQSKILVLDEATASVDTATDNLIQKIIRREFNDCTVCTIAHRIPTVIDSDLVLVLSDGQVAEFDTPSRLLEDKSSMFLKLVSEYSSRSSGIPDF